MVRALVALGMLAPAVAFASDALPRIAVAPGVYVIGAGLAEPSADNGGRVVNTGFIVGPAGVTVIDSGASRRHGEAILATIRAVTKRPVRLVINTHPHPHNVLGNSAFARRGIPILATAVTRDKMRERCLRCLQMLAESVGKEALRGTEIRLPDRVAIPDTVIESGGRRLKLLHFGHGHTEGDLAVLDLETGTLFAGDLVYRDQIPHLAESDVNGWISALERLGAESYSILVPGRGPVGDGVDADPVRRYLSGVLAKVEAAYAAGQTATEAIASADLPGFSTWHGYAERHGRNVQLLYFGIERADLMKGGQ